jgi:hypothetical protein
MKLYFQGYEQHVCLPKYTPFILTQNLYEVLFQYVIDPEHEKNLRAFIERLENYIKSRNRAPFSVPRSELEFLQEGLQELRMLNWAEIPVAVFRLETDADAAADYENLSALMTCAFRPETSTLYVYPKNTVF